MKVRPGTLVYAWCAGTPCWKEPIESPENLGNIDTNEPVIMLCYNKDDMCHVLTRHGVAWVFAGNLCLVKGPGSLSLP